jgi:hypothetical protein
MNGPSGHSQQTVEIELRSNARCEKRMVKCAVEGSKSAIYVLETRTLNLKIINSNTNICANSKDRLGDFAQSFAMVDPARARTANMDRW